MTCNEAGGYLSREPDAVAILRGDGERPWLRGRAELRDTDCGLLLTAEIQGLPQGEGCAGPLYSFCICDCGDCGGVGFPHTGACRIARAGELPPLFSCGGTACYAALTESFTAAQLAGRALVICEPAGKKIACGRIIAAAREN